MQSKAKRTIRLTDLTQEKWIVVGLLMLTLGLRVYLAGIDRVVWGDEPFYLWLGRNWLTGQGYTFTGYSDVHHTPMYPLLTGLVYLITHDMELASEVCYVVFGTLLAVPIYLTVRRFYGKTSGYISVLLLAVWPALTAAVMRWGTLTEPPYYFFIYAGVYCAIRAMEGDRWQYYGGAGALFAMAYLTRPEAIGYLVVVGAALAVIKLFERRLLSRQVLIGLALYLVGFLVFFGPYAWYVRQHTGSWMVTEKAGVTFVTGIGLSEGDTAAFDRTTWGLDNTGLEVFFFSRESYDVSIMDYVRQYPMEFARLLYRNAWRFLTYLTSSRLFPSFLVPLVALSLFAVPWNKLRAKRELMWMASAAPVLAFIAFFIQDRYIAVLLPTLLIWVADGFRRWGGWLADTLSGLLSEGKDPECRSESRLAPVWRGVCVGLPVALLVAFCVYRLPATLLTTSSGSYRMAHKEVGVWLEDRVDSDTVIMSRYPAIAFHADARWVPTPNAEIPETLKYAQHKGVEYFVVDEREVVHLRPQFGVLLEEETLPSGLEWVSGYDSEGERLAILRIAGTGVD